MSFARKLLSLGVVFISVTLASCTFRPLYSDEVSDELQSIFVATIPDREGQILRNRLRYLIEGHGASKTPRYTLDVQLVLSEDDLGVNRTGTVTRKNQVVTASYKLIDRETRDVVYASSVKVENPFAIQQRQFYANPVTEEHARKQSLELAAQLMVSEIALYFRKNEN